MQHYHKHKGFSKVVIALIGIVLIILCWTIYLPFRFQESFTPLNILSYFPGNELLTLLNSDIRLLPFTDIISVKSAYYISVFLLFLCIFTIARFLNQIHKKVNKDTAFIYDQINEWIDAISQSYQYPFTKQERQILESVEAISYYFKYTKDFGNYNDAITNIENNIYRVIEQCYKIIQEDKTRYDELIKLLNSVETQLKIRRQKIYAGE